VLELQQLEQEQLELHDDDELQEIIKED